MRSIGKPEPGFYKRRLTKGGPWVAVRFFIENAVLRVEVDGRTHRAGQPIDPYEEWPLCWPSNDREFAFFAMLREWAVKHQPNHPAARPEQPIDLNAIPPRTRR